jgi:hypothetical protein
VVALLSYCDGEIEEPVIRGSKTGLMDCAGWKDGDCEGGEDGPANDWTLFKPILSLMQKNEYLE